jgi:hypothetical protein
MTRFVLLHRSTRSKKNGIAVLREGLKPAMAPDAAALMIASRAGQHPGVIDPSVPLCGRAFTIRLNVEKRTGRRSREVAVRITDNAREPYWVMSWKAR